jgi:hypothetical protein
MIIPNGRNRPLNALTGTVPDVSGALLDWFQPTTFGIVVKEIDNFQVVETMTNVTFQAVVQPLPQRKLEMKPEGQRKWEWLMIHAEPGLVLVNDQVITYLGKQYRVMDQWDYRIYGYVEYHIMEDYTGAGPTVSP